MGSSGLVESGSGQARGRSSRARGPGPRGHDDSPWGSGPGRDGGGRPKARPFRLDPSDGRGVQDRARSASRGALDIAEARVTGVRTEPRSAGTCTNAMARCRSRGVVDPRVSVPEYSHRPQASVSRTSTCRTVLPEKLNELLTGVTGPQTGSTGICGSALAYGARKQPRRVESPKQRG